MNSPSQEPLAAALSAVVAETMDVADVLAHLVVDCAATTPADAAALLTVDSNGDLSLLAADSHRAEALEMLQIQGEQGPCVDVIAANEPLLLSGADALVARWGEVGEAIVAAGFTAVEAYPMRWQGRALGGLNLFHAQDRTTPIGTTAQAFADMATMVVVQSMPLSEDQVKARMHEALSSRATVEQAKGVLAYRLGTDLAEAYTALLRRAWDDGKPLTQTAIDIVDEAQEAKRHGKD
jgi:signal transduction protein with GAF and PtsI domain